MPELPEVETTVRGIQKEAKGYLITRVWTNYSSNYIAHRKQIKDKKYFEYFSKKVIGRTIRDAFRVGKNVLIELDSGDAILTHMKMTGHYIFGHFVKTNDSGDPWKADPEFHHSSPLLLDSFNKRIRLVFTLEKKVDGHNTKKYLALSDMRKFAKVILIEEINRDNILKDIGVGPDPLSDDFNYEVFHSQILKKKTGKIKSVLMDQSVISGIGNIYSDEILWQCAIHPESKVGSIPLKKIKEMCAAMKKILKRGIDFGGDSMSDYRNIYGEKGHFQNKHNVYRKTGTKCNYKKCNGTIQRKIIGSRSGHFCPTHQEKYT